MTNSEISQKLKLAAQLMELHGENPFKIRSYQSAREVLSKLSVEVSSMDVNEIGNVEGIGKSLTQSILDLLSTGTFDLLNSLREATPAGVVEMLRIPGFGPKKIGVLWKEAGAETLEDVLQLCERQEVSALKGFGDKTQSTLMEAVIFIIGCRGKEKYANVEHAAEQIFKAIEKIDSVIKVAYTGAYRRNMEILEQLEYIVSTTTFEATRNQINDLEIFTANHLMSGPFTWVGEVAGCSLPVKITFALPEQFILNWVRTSSSPKHWSQLRELTAKPSVSLESESKYYHSLGLDYIEPAMREGVGEIELAATNSLPELVQMTDLKGILHNHSTYSDGKHTLRQMAEYCRDLGYEYLGISDHSQTAVYANGLSEENVIRQQEEIKALNIELAPFKIFSGIESDILADGSLDYSDALLSSFDFVVSSIHSGLVMDRTKATDRLLAAIHNPFTTILGHMTGRLLLEREGYPVDHKVIIDACAVTKTVIEINASPYRLDMDWRWISYAIEKGVMLSINPDAHKMEGYHDMKYGVLVGQKGGLTKRLTLNAMNLDAIEEFFTIKRNGGQ